MKSLCSVKKIASVGDRCLICPCPQNGETIPGGGHHTKLTFVILVSISIIFPLGLVSAQSVFDPLYPGMTWEDAQAQAEWIEPEFEPFLMLDDFIYPGNDFKLTKEMRLPAGAVVSVVLDVTSQNDLLPSTKIASICTFDSSFVTPRGIKVGMPVAKAYDLMVHPSPRFVPGFSKQIFDAEGVTLEFGVFYSGDPVEIYASDTVHCIAQVPVLANKTLTDSWQPRHMQPDFSEWLYEEGWKEPGSRLVPALRVGMRESEVEKVAQLSGAIKGHLDTGTPVLYVDAYMTGWPKARLGFCSMKSPGHYDLEREEDLLLYMIEITDTNYVSPSGLSVGMYSADALMLMESPVRWDKIGDYALIIDPSGMCIKLGADYSSEDTYSPPVGLVTAIQERGAFRYLATAFGQR